MKICAYPETYLSKAMVNLGDAFQYAVDEMGLEGDDFMAMFSASAVASRWQNGEAAYLVGRSGKDTADEVILETTGIQPVGTEEESYMPTPSYWCGWALCYYQWKSCLSFKDIFDFVKYDDLTSMYRTLHEADVTRFAEEMDGKYLGSHKEKRLKIVRRAYGYSQSRLAEESGVSLRSIQMYEQGNKDINKGQVSTIYRLARTLGCSMEDLLEYVPGI